MPIKQTNVTHRRHSTMYYQRETIDAAINMFMMDYRKSHTVNRLIDMLYDFPNKVGFFSDELNWDEEILIKQYQAKRGL